MLTCRVRGACLCAPRALRSRNQRNRLIGSETTAAPPGFAAANSRGKSARRSPSTSAGTTRAGLPSASSTTSASYAPPGATNRSSASGDDATVPRSRKIVATRADIVVASVRASAACSPVKSSSARASSRREST